MDKRWKLPVKQLKDLTAEQRKKLCGQAENDPELWHILLSLSVHDKGLKDEIFPQLGLGGKDHMMMVYGNMCRIDERRKMGG